MSDFEGRIWRVDKYWGAMLVRREPNGNTHHEYATDLFNNRSDALDWLDRKHKWWTGERSGQETVEFA